MAECVARRWQIAVTVMAWLPGGRVPVERFLQHLTTNSCRPAANSVRRGCSNQWRKSSKTSLLKCGMLEMSGASRCPCPAGTRLARLLGAAVLLEPAQAARNAHTLMLPSSCRALASMCGFSREAKRLTPDLRRGTTMIGQVLADQQALFGAEIVAAVADNVAINRPAQFPDDVHSYHDTSSGRLQPYRHGDRRAGPRREIPCGEGSAFASRGQARLLWKLTAAVAA